MASKKKVKLLNIYLGNFMQGDLTMSSGIESRSESKLCLNKISADVALCLKLSVTPRLFQ